MRTNYTLDINRGLTQVLADAANIYLCGVTRIRKQGPSGWAYHLPDALGSVRQMADPEASVAFTRAYEPFGSQMLMAGPAASPYGFAGEWRDATELMYLRARYYAPYFGAFIQPDPWPGNGLRPQTLNDFAYVINNPATWVDPAGWSHQPSIAGLASTGLRPRDSVTAELLSGLAGRSPYSKQPVVPVCKPESSSPANQERCTELLRLIEETVKVLKKRYFDIREDRLNLPLTGPMSVEGHREQFEGWQRRLREFLEEWDTRNCGPRPPGAWHWASVPAPKPAPKDTNQVPYQLPIPEETAENGLVVTLTEVS